MLHFQILNQDREHDTSCSKKSNKNISLPAVEESRTALLLQLLHSVASEMFVCSSVSASCDCSASSCIVILDSYEKKHQSDGKPHLAPINKTMVVRCGRLRWFGHVERKSGDDWVLACRNVEVAGVRCAGRGRKTCERMCEGWYGGIGFAPWMGSVQGYVERPHIGKNVWP